MPTVSNGVVTWDQRCAGGTWTRLARTTGGGQHWQLLPDPGPSRRRAASYCPDQACVSWVSFASPMVGYLYGPALLMTTDGGLTWHVQPGTSLVEKVAVGFQRTPYLPHHVIASVRILECPGIKVKIR